MMFVKLLALGAVGYGHTCPILDQAPSGGNMKTFPGMQGKVETDMYVEALKKIDWDEVKEDIKKVMKDSQDYWPADYGHYGPLFVRLGWHCAGSYRNSDGRGGCDGGRMNFDPERSWDDNTNLDKARRILWPVKEKHGLGLSYGDLYILAANVAIEDMGGPVLGFCAGRVDDTSGKQSIVLGPSPEQEEGFPCAVQGQCKAPLGSVQVGLIYVNPEGPGGNPDPALSAESVREVFSRMSMNDRETVALVGGGHAFGKTHGACPNGPGPRPSEDQVNPWPGMCGDGKGDNQFTSGFEGPWSHTPIEWSNNYFKYLHKNTFEKEFRDGLPVQWKIKKGVKGEPVIPPAPGAHGGTQDIRMLTADVCFQADPKGIYQQLVKEYAEDIEVLNKDFSEAWYKLTTRDMGPVTRCMGPDVPAARPFQAPLPATPLELPYSMPDVESALMTMLERNKKMAPLMVRTAFSCAMTFRQTDYSGGCNGARLRLSPEKDFELNAGLGAALSQLETFQKKYSGISMADLIVLAGNTAIKMLGGPELVFCGGRTDAAMDEVLTEREFLEPRITGKVTDTVFDTKYQGMLWGLTNEELVALIGGGGSVDMLHSKMFNLAGGRSEFGNGFFKELFKYNWLQKTVQGLPTVYINECALKGCPKRFILETHYMLRYDHEFFPHALNFAGDEDYFMKVFAQAWTKLMNADRFDGPNGNVCDNRRDLLLVPESMEAQIDALFMAKDMEHMVEEMEDEMDGLSNTVASLKAGGEEKKSTLRKFFLGLLEGQNNRRRGRTNRMEGFFGSSAGLLDQAAKVSGYVAMVSALVYLVATFLMKPKRTNASLTEETPILAAA